jgi:hypothetical protein
MAGTFPTLSSGNVLMYPATRTVAAVTRVLRSLDDSEKRFRCAPFISSWDLQYSALRIADVDTLAEFFDDQKGAYDTWSFPFDGATYAHLCFDQDEFSATEAPLGQWSTTLRIRQVKQSGTYNTGVAAVYPTIDGGVITQIPYTAARRYLTTRVDMPSGLRYSRHERDNPLLAWTCSYPAARNTEAGTLMNFFTSMGGKWRAFTFTDPQTEVEYTARFSQDEFSRRFVGFNQNNIVLQLEQVAA